MLTACVRPSVVLRCPGRGCLPRDDGDRCDPALAVPCVPVFVPREWMPRYTVHVRMTPGQVLGELVHELSSCRDTVSSCTRSSKHAGLAPQYLPACCPEPTAPGWASHTWTRRCPAVSVWQQTEQPRLKDRTAQGGCFKSLRHCYARALLWVVRVSSSDGLLRSIKFSSWFRLHVVYSGQPQRGNTGGQESMPQRG